MYAKQEYELVFAVVAFMLIFMSEIQHIPGLFLEGIAVLQECFQDDSFPECCHNCPPKSPFVLETCTVDFTWQCDETVMHFKVMTFICPVVIRCRYFMGIHTKNNHPVLYFHQYSGYHCLAVYEDRNILVE